MLASAADEAAVVVEEGPHGDTWALARAQVKRAVRERSWEWLDALHPWPS